MSVFRNLSLEQLMDKLQELDRRRVDLVVPPSLLQMSASDLHINASDYVRHYATDQCIPDQVTIRPNSVAHRQISDKLGIPKRYYDRMRAEHPNLLDDNVNGWLTKSEQPYLLRTYRDDDSDAGQPVATGRALLSRRFKCIDNIHLLMSVLRAIQREKLAVVVETADITETKMYVRFVAPDVVVGANGLLKGYKNPKTLEVGDGVMAGFTLRNSEVGMGRYEIAPRAQVLVCKNGMIREKDVWGKNHLGTKLDEGAIDWSEDTYKHALNLIQSQVSDYVRHFASEEYLSKWLSEITELGNYQVKHPIACIENVTRHFSVTENDTESILDYFTLSNQNTAFGVAQAITYHAHQIGDPDKRNDLESLADQVLVQVPKWDNRLPAGNTKIVASPQYGLGL
ncbi:hypothetical protein [Tunicatimonas pelagia]|uniref:hypothetical protein n=1 Tax=Tunicatimonas pelagia TaxID=931531 RepID=UPI00266552C3|nr:hypothetical protein [Tunicatimonas pelagia]WKN46501.1 hypothetical protein P0M28_30590 [Tunicatimonas pelagia]